MKSVSLENIDFKQSIPYLLSACIAFFITRSSIPFFKYPFLLLFIILSLMIFSGYRNRVLIALKEFRNDLLLPVILFLYLIAACFLSDKIYLVVIKDISSSFILLLLVFYAKIFIRTENELQDFIRSFVNVLIILSVLISFQRVYQYLFVSSYSDQYSDLYISPYRDIVDYNFALVPVFFGMAGIFCLFRKRLKSYTVILFTIILLWFSFSFIISGSKRGMLAFIFIYLISIFISIWSLFTGKQKFRQFCINSKYFLITFSLSVILVIVVFLNSSVYFKNDLLKKIGVRNIAYTKVLVSDTFFRYFHFFIHDTNSTGVYQKIWQPVFDPRDPDAAYGSGNYKVTDKLPGNGGEIVPEGTKGFLLDSTCLGFASKTHTYYFLEIFRDSVNAGDSVVSSVYCYVSPDFNGNGVALRAEGSITGNPDVFISPDEKGVWKKLVLPLNCTTGIIKIFLYMNKADASDFSLLKGYVIFAYPEFRNVSSTYKVTETSLQKIKSGSFLQGKPVSGLCYSPIWRSSETIMEPAIAGMLWLPLNNLASLNGIILKSDPIRNWLTKIVSEDTTWHRFNSDLTAVKKNEKLGEDRIERWKYAGKIFIKEYNWNKRIFGGGFNFLNWYGYAFLDDKTKSDWPHNPFLSVLLYSGIPGLVLYCFFLIKGSLYYYRYFNKTSLMVVFFTITFYFSFFSAGSPLDPPIMGFFALLPFFIHSVHRRDCNTSNRSK